MNGLHWIIRKDLLRFFSDRKGAAMLLVVTSGVFVKVESTLDTAEETLVSIGQLSRKIDGAIDEVTKGVNAFEKMTTNVDAFVEENRRPVADFSATGLYEMTQFLIDARELIQTLNRVSIRLENDPARFLFGDTHGGVQAQ